MSDKSMEMPVRVASLEYLGLVASRLRRDSVTSRAKLATMDAVVRDIRAEEEKDGCQQQVYFMFIVNVGEFVCLLLSNNSDGYL